MLSCTVAGIHEIILMNISIVQLLCNWQYDVISRPKSFLIWNKWNVVDKGVILLLFILAKLLAFMLYSEIIQIYF